MSPIAPENRGREWADKLEAKILRWATFTDAAARKLGDLPVLIVGAEYDRQVAEDIARQVEAKGRKCVLMIEAVPPVQLTPSVFAAEA